MMQQSEDRAPAGQGEPLHVGMDAAPARRSAEAQSLLQDIDHRVKNNLQLIASLIQLQARRTQEPAPQAALKTVLERVNAITTVHRRLFQGDIHRFDADDFLRDLVGDLAATAGREDITVSLSLDPVQIPAASAAAFALIVNELVGNTLKHAFPERAGRVDILLVQEGDTCVLTIAEDGVGLNDAPPGFGLTLVRLLCRQLHSDLDLVPAAGVTAVMRTPLTRSHA
jgi:two-component sensor histidine kinase